MATASKKTTTKTATKTTKVTSYAKELSNAIKKVYEYKLACEANIVGILFKSSDLYFEHSDLTIDNFSNNIWKCYFEIGRGIVLDENKPTLDEITIGIYLDKHLKLKSKYEEYGGFETILKAQKFVKIENLDGYIGDLYKWNAVISLGKSGFPISENLARYADMSLDDIYAEKETLLNHVFINAESDLKSYDISDGLYDLIAEMKKGLNVGLPYHNMPILNRETMGMMQGHVTLIGALSNVGKSSFFRNTVVNSCIMQNKKLVIIINEEDEKRWKSELLVWVANVILKKDLQKFVVNGGKFDSETESILNNYEYFIK